MASATGTGPQAVAVLPGASTFSRITPIRRLAANLRGTIRDEQARHA
jgi:hypothetical protein